MFDVLMYLYETAGARTPARAATAVRKLSAVGFESDGSRTLKKWLDGLADSAASCTGQQGEHSLQVYSDAERGCSATTPSASSASSNPAGVLPPYAQMVVDRASAIGNGPMQLDDLKIIVLMVFWSLGENRRADPRRVVRGRPRTPDSLIPAAWRKPRQAEPASVGRPGRH